MVPAGLLARDGDPLQGCGAIHRARRVLDDLEPETLRASWRAAIHLFAKQLENLRTAFGPGSDRADRSVGRLQRIRQFVRPDVGLVIVECRLFRRLLTNDFRIRAPSAFALRALARRVHDKNARPEDRGR
jgi:hypothetical protein